MEFWVCHELIEPLFANKYHAHLFELAVFMLLGAFVSVAILHASTPEQAFAIGAGWTAFFGEVTPKPNAGEAER